MVHPEVAVGTSDPIRRCVRAFSHSLRREGRRSTQSFIVQPKARPELHSQLVRSLCPDVQGIQLLFEQSQDIERPAAIVLELELLEILPVDLPNLGPVEDEGAKGDGLNKDIHLPKGVPKFEKREVFLADRLGLVGRSPLPLP